MRGNHFIAAGLAVMFCQAVACGAQAGKSKDAVAYQIDVAHSGHGKIAGFTGNLKLLWTVNLGAGAISYPLIADGLVFVTVANSGNYGTELFALNPTSGATVWKQALSGTYFWSNAAYENGQVFVVNYDGLVSAFAAATGALNWAAQMPNQYAFSSPPTARKGTLYLGGAGSGGTLYAVNETNGALLWSDSVENGDNSSPALGDGGVYVSYPCQYYSFAAKTGGLNWNDNLGCDGGGGKTPVYFGGQVYVRDPGQGDFILDAKTGAQLGTFSATPAPAFLTDGTKTYRFTLSGGVLGATDVASGKSLWSFAGDGGLSTAPITVGHYVVEGSTSGNLYVLGAKRGTLVSTTNVGASIPGPDEQNVSQPLTGLGAGDGILVVPAGSQISAYAPQ